MTKNSIFTIIASFSKILAEEKHIEIDEINDYQKYEKIFLEHLTEGMKGEFEDYKYARGAFVEDLMTENCSRMIFLGMKIGMEFQTFLDNVEEKS